VILGEKKFAGERSRTEILDERSSPYIAGALKSRRVRDRDGKCSTLYGEFIVLAGNPKGMWACIAQSV